MPTYKPNIPQPADIMSQSQNDILENFQQINTVFAVNHVAFEAAGEGKHTQVTLPENPAPTNTAAAEANIYAQLSAITNNTELYWQREGNGTRIEWTGLLAQTNGWTRLPSGILLKWGNAPSVGFDSTVVYPAGGGIEAFANIPNNPFITLVVASPGAPGVSVVANVIGGSQTRLQFQFSVFDTDGSAFVANINYLSIGV
jgi:hypothetical protein